MRRIATWLLVGAVAALGVAAGIDALRGGGEPERAEEAEPLAQTATVAQEPVGALATAVADLRKAGITGVLTYAERDCAVRSLTLPDLEPHPGPEGRACRFRSTVGGELVLGGPPTSPYGGLTSRCRLGMLELRLPNKDLYARAPGCGIAWKPDGTPTFLHEGELRTFVACPQNPGALPMRCTRTMVSQRDLTREFRRARWTDFDFAVEQVHWLTDSRFAAIVRARSEAGHFELMAVFQGRRLLSGPTFGYEDLDVLRPSPRGTLVAAHIVSPGGLLVVDHRGRPVRLAMRHGQALAWSPDEEWIAEATADGIYVFQADEDSPEFVYVAIVARDLVWR